MVAVIDWLPEDEQVAPVMLPPPLLVEDELVEDELVELELVLLLDVELLLELDDPVPPYEQYRGLPTLVDGNSEAEQVIGPVRVAYTKLPDFP
jgi:hypothetical protein